MTLAEVPESNFGESFLIVAMECGFGRNRSSTSDGVCQEFAIGFETP